MTLENFKKAFSTYVINNIKKSEDLPIEPFYIDYGQGIARKKLYRYYDISFMPCINDTALKSKPEVEASILIDISVYVNKLLEHDPFKVDFMTHNVFKILKPTVTLDNGEKIKIKNIRTEEIDNNRLKQTSISFDVDFMLKNEEA